MKVKMFCALVALAEMVCWDNEGDGDEAAAAAAAAEAAAKAKSAEEKKFTQQEVDKIVISRNKNLKTQYEQLETNYNKLLEQTNLTEEARNQIQADLENVQNLMRSKEQNLELAAKKAKEKYDADLRNASLERDRFKTLFETSTIERAIVDAAAKNEAWDPTQFVKIIGNQAKIVEELTDAGEKTGRLVPRIEWEVSDSTGTVSKVLKTPEEVIGLMKEDTQKHGNLFRSNVARGLGSGNAAGINSSAKVDVSKLSAQQYAEMRKTPEGRKALGLS
jgi:hypothetical protein